LPLERTRTQSKEISGPVLALLLARPGDGAQGALEAFAAAEGGSHLAVAGPADLKRQTRLLFPDGALPSLSRVALAPPLTRPAFAARGRTGTRESTPPPPATVLAEPSPAEEAATKLLLETAVYPVLTRGLADLCKAKPENPTVRDGGFLLLLLLPWAWLTPQLPDRPPARTTHTPHGPCRQVWLGNWLLEHVPNKPAIQAAQ
jgi:hypothetical protein